MQLIGIDGALLGHWVTASRTLGSAAPPTFDLTLDLRDVFSLAAAAGAVIVIDVPIGLPSGGAAVNGRVCDSQARKVVGPIRASSVFSAPCREAFGSANHPEASGRNRHACGRGLSCQAFGILGRIESVDALMTPSLQHGVREGHPEVTFATLAGRFLEHPKTTQAGREERLRLLEGHEVAFDMDAERRRLGRRFVGRDDMIDAGSLLVSAHRVASGEAVVLGDDSLDIRNLLMQMWA